MARGDAVEKAELAGEEAEEDEDELSAAVQSGEQKADAEQEEREMQEQGMSKEELHVEQGLATETSLSFAQRAERKALAEGRAARSLEASLLEDSQDALLQLSFLQRGKTVRRSRFLSV